MFDIIMLKKSVFFKFQFGGGGLQPGIPHPLVWGVLPRCSFETTGTTKLFFFFFVRVVKTGRMQVFIFTPIAKCFAEVPHHLRESCSEQLNVGLEDQFTLRPQRYAFLHMFYGQIQCYYNVIEEEEEKKEIKRRRRGRGGEAVFLR